MKRLSQRDFVNMMIYQDRSRKPRALQRVVRRASLFAGSLILTGDTVSFPGARLLEAHIIFLFSQAYFRFARALVPCLHSGRRTAPASFFAPEGAAVQKRGQFLDPAIRTNAAHGVIDEAASCAVLTRKSAVDEFVDPGI